jgi:predicted Zn-dependent protease
MKDHLSAAQGWLELDNPVEANRELDKINPSLRIHPDVLEVRWQIHAKREWWIAACEIAKAICELAPERPSGWLHQAHSLSELGCTEKALRLLEGVVNRFTETSAISYNLARYACRLGREGEAVQWFERAAAREDRSKIARMALEESDLKPLWRRIQSAIPKRQARSLPLPENPPGLSRRYSPSWAGCYPPAVLRRKTLGRIKPL